MKLRLLCSILLLFSFGKVFAQNYPVQITPQFLPPSPIYLSSYADGTTTNSPLRVQLLLNDITLSNREVRLKIYIEGTGINLQGSDLVIGSESIYLDGGVPLTLTNELAPYFELKNMQGINPANYANPLSEGSYQFCFEVYDAFTGNKLSNKTCASTLIFQNDPPFLNIPFKDEEIAVNNPQNIVFQWTPRHINVSNVEYELSIVEIWDHYVDPQAAFFSMPPIFQVTTRNTSYLMGPSDPPLLPNKKYAWRVKAKALQGAEEIGLFKNHGYSEIYWFNHTQPCEAPPGLYAELKGASKVNIFWEPNPEAYKSYTIAYREAGDTESDWYIKTTNSDWVTIWDLKPGTTYEYMVKGICELGESEYSESQTITTELLDNSDSFYSCGLVPDEIAISNREPLPTLIPGDEIYAGDFVVTVTDVSGGNGIYSGRGYVKIPYLNLITLGVTFNGILVNTAHQLAEGEIVTLYDPAFGKGAEMTVDVSLDFSNASNLDYEDIYVDGEIQSVAVNSEGNIVVQTTSGPVTINTQGDSSSGGPAVEPGTPVKIKDDTGNEYTVVDGVVTQGGGDSITNENSNELTGAGKALVTFEKAPQSRYGLDVYKKEYESTKLKRFYPEVKAGEKNYFVSWKALASGKMEPLLAKIEVKDNGLDLNKISFETNTGSKYTSQGGTDANERTVQLAGKGNMQEEELYAFYPTDSTALTLGRINTVSYDEVRHKVVVIPIGKSKYPGNATELQNGLNTIYSQAAVTWEVEVLQTPLDVTYKSPLIVGEKGNNYISSLKEIINAYKRTKPVNKNTYYLFIADKLQNESGKDVEGYMLRGGQYGFIAVNSQNIIKTIAHELGHGAFHLKHAFSKYDVSETSDNLMSYSNGFELVKDQWDDIHNPALIIGLLESDEDGEYDPWEYVSGNDFLISEIPRTKDTDVLSFVSTAGVVYSVIGKARDFSFINGFLVGFTIDGERYISGKGSTSKKVKGYFADVKDSNTKYEDKLSKDLDFDNLYVYYGYVNKNTSDCNAKNSIYKTKYIGEKISGSSYGFTSLNEISLADDNEVHDKNSKIIDFSNFEDYADVADVFNCLKGDDLKFLYKYIEYKHPTSKVNFLNDLFEKLNKFESVFIGGLTTDEKFNKETDELHYLNLDNSNDVTLFKDAINTFVKNNSEYSAKRLKIVLKDDQEDTIFPEGIAEFIPFYESIFNCFLKEQGTFDIEGYYVPLCVWKDVEVSESMYYGRTDPAFMAGVADGGIGLVVDLYKLALGLQKINLAYGLKLQDCSPNNEFLIGEYSKVLNRLKNINANLSLDRMIVIAPPGTDFVLLKTIIKYKKVIDAVKNGTDITDEHVRKIANILDKLEEFTPDKFKEWYELTNKIENKLVDISAFGNITCEEAQQVRDNTVEALEFIEKLSDPAEFETKKLVFNEIKKSLLEYKDKTLATDNVARHTHGKIVFEIVAEIFIAVLTEGGGNIAKGTGALMSKMVSLTGKMDNIVKLAIKKADNIAGILIKRNRVFTPNGRTLLMVADENGVYKLYKVLPDDATNVKLIENTKFEDVDIELPNGTRLEDQDIDFVESNGDQYVRLLDESYNILDEVDNISRLDFFKSIERYTNITEAQKNEIWNLWANRDIDGLFDYMKTNKFNIEPSKNDMPWPPFSGFKSVKGIFKGDDIKKEIARVSGKEFDGTFDRFQENGTETLGGGFASPVYKGEYDKIDIPYTYDSRAMLGTLEEGTVYIKFKIKDFSGLEIKYGEAIPWKNKFGKPLDGNADQVEILGKKFHNLEEGLDYEIVQKSIYRNGKWDDIVPDRSLIRSKIDKLNCE